MGARGPHALPAGGRSPPQRALGRGRTSPGWALADTALQHEGRPQPRRLHMAAQRWARCLSFSKSRDEHFLVSSLLLSCFLELRHEPGLPEPSRVPASFGHGLVLTALLLPPGSATASRFWEALGVGTGVCAEGHTPL